MSQTPPGSTSEPADNGRPIADLAMQAKAGDVSAFEKLYLCRYAQICSFLIHMMGSEEVGRDLAHDTFLKAWQELANLRDVSCFDGWLYRIARNLAHNKLRRQLLIRWSPLKEFEEPSTEEYSVVAGFEKDIEEKILLRQALAEVSQKYRECLILQVVHGMPQSKIAELLNISKESVSKYVSRGLAQLRQAYLRLDYEGYSLAKES